MTAAPLALLLPSLAGGGAERLTLTLAATLVGQGHAVDLVLLRREGELIRAVPPGVRLVVLGAAKLRHSVRPLARYLRQAKPAALQASMWPLTTCAVIAHRLARSRARLVLTDHVNLSADLLCRHGPLFRAAARAVIAASYPLADARTAVSAGVAADMAALSGLDRTRFTVIPNMTPAVAPDGPQADWGGAGARLLSVGTLKAQKNQRLLLEAAARVMRDRPARLALVGEGALRPALEDHARALGIEDRVLMPGFTDPAPWFRSAELFVLSSDFEGMPMVLLEALSHGLPIVSTDCPDGPREVLADGAYGTLVPPDDAEALARAVLDALDHPADRERLRVRGAAFAPGPIAERYLAVMLP